MSDPFALVSAGDANGLRALLAADASLATARDDNGTSLVRQAAYHRRPDLVEVVLAADPPLDAFDAATLGRVDGTDVDPNSIAGDGFPLLSLACFFGHLDTAAALLDRGADPDIVATNGSLLRPIHGAAAAGRADIVALLLERGADPNAEQTGGSRAIDAARQHDDTEMIAILLAAGAQP